MTSKKLSPATDSTGLRMMAVHAHPDDESSKGAAVMAMYSSQGAQVHVVTCTGGERGDVLNPRLIGNKDIEENIVEVRRAEMALAASILGVSQHWLGYEDSGFPDGIDGPNPPELPVGCFARVPIEAPVRDLVECIRRFRPHVMTTYDENGGYPHPDHIRCHEISMAAYAVAGDPSYETGQQPWQPLKIYYNGTFAAVRVQALHEAVLGMGQESPYGGFLERLKSRPDRPVHAKVPCSEFFPQRDDALRAHATQVDPDGIFFAVPPEVAAKVWPTEEFEIGHSYLPYDNIEDDLFCGIRGTDYVLHGGPLGQSPLVLVK